MKNVPKDILASMVCEQKERAKVAERVSGFEKAPEREQAKEQKAKKPVKPRAKKPKDDEGESAPAADKPKVVRKKKPAAKAAARAPTPPPRSRSPRKSPRSPPKSPVKSFHVAAGTVTISAGDFSQNYKLENGNYRVRAEAGRLIIERA